MAKGLPIEQGSLGKGARSGRSENHEDEGDYDRRNYYCADRGVRRIKHVAPLFVVQAVLCPNLRHLVPCTNV